MNGTVSTAGDHKESSREGGTLGAWSPTLPSGCVWMRLVTVHHAHGKRASGHASRQTLYFKDGYKEKQIVLLVVPNGTFGDLPPAVFFRLIPCCCSWSTIPLYHFFLCLSASSLSVLLLVPYRNFFLLGFICCFLSLCIIKQRLVIYQIDWFHDKIYL